jgi:hypothetical protein
VEHIAAVFTYDVDHRLIGGVLVRGGQKDDLFLNHHVGGSTDGTLWRLRTGPEMIGDRTLLVGGQGHEEAGGYKGEKIVEW